MDYKYYTRQIQAKSYETADCHSSFFSAEHDSLLNNAVGNSDSAQCFEDNHHHEL